MDLIDYFLAKKCRNENCEILIKSIKINKCPKCDSLLISFYDYYRIFKLNPTNNLKENNTWITTLKKNYKKLSLLFHPDKNPSTNASESFIILQNGFQTLLNSQEREEYQNNFENYKKKEANNEILFDLNENYNELHQYKNSPSNSSQIHYYNQANLLSGIITSLLGFILCQYSTGNFWLSFFCLTFILSLAIIYKKFYIFSIAISEIIGFIFTFIFIIKGNLIGGFIFMLILLTYFIKIKKIIKFYLLTY